MDDIAPKPARTRSRRVELVVLSLVLAASLAWILHRGALPLLPPAGVLSNVALVPAFVFGTLMLISMLAKYGRYHFLLSPFAKLPVRRLMSISSIAMALITFLPFRIGEISRPAMLREKGKVSGWALTGTVGAERIIDGVAFAALLVIGLVFARPHEPVPDHIGALPVPATIVPQAAVVASLGFGAAFLVMVAFFRFRKTARNITERVVGVISDKLARRLADIVERMSDGLRFLPNLKFLAPYLALTLVSMLGHVWAMVWLASAVGLPPLSFGESSVLVGVLAIGFALPNAPGFFGAVQLALYAGLALYVPPAAVVREGAGLVFIFYASYLGIVLGLALLGLLLESRVFIRPTDA